MESVDPAKTRIYHITDILNLDAILASGELRSDALMRQDGMRPAEIGYTKIKERRLTQYRIACCGDRFVGEFVPFYFCPRSPMLYTINKGNTGREAGCQKTILHLVSTVQNGYDLQVPWAISDGNAGSAYTTFSNSKNALDRVNWEIVQSHDWEGERLRIKASEFLVAERFPVSSLTGIGCYDEEIAAQARSILAKHFSNLPVKAIPTWYY